MQFHVLHKLYHIYVLSCNWRTLHVVHIFRLIIRGQEVFKHVITGVTTLFWWKAMGTIQIILHLTLELICECLEMNDCYTLWFRWSCRNRIVPQLLMLRLEIRMFHIYPYNLAVRFWYRLLHIHFFRAVAFELLKSSHFCSASLIAFSFCLLQVSWPWWTLWATPRWLARALEIVEEANLNCD